MEQSPHRAVGRIVDTIVGSVRSLGNSLVGAVKGAGHGVVNGLDAPFTAITGKEGPLHIVDRLADGAIDAGVNFVDSGVVGSVQKAGEGVMEALDWLPEQTGIPPKIGLPKIFKR